MSGLLDLLGGSVCESAGMAIGQRLDLSPQQTNAATATALPILLGRLDQQRGVDAEGLTSLPQGAHATQAQPGRMGLATQLFDTNHNGSVVDDLTQGLDDLFRRR